MGTDSAAEADAAGRIVVGVDGSRDSAAALAWALDLAEARRAPVSVVSVLPEPRAVSPWGVLSVMAGVAGDGVAAAREQVMAVVSESLGARARELAMELTVDVLVGNPAELLVEATPPGGQLVVGSRGLGGFGRLMLGSVSDAVVHHARGPVTVVRGQVSRTVAARPVVVGVDGSLEGQLALQFALRRAREMGTALHVLHAWALLEGPWPAHEPGTVPPMAAFEAKAGRELARLSEPALSGDVTVVQRLVRDSAGAALVAASTGAAEVIVGSRGRGGFTGLLLGSTSAQVVRHAECPATVVHPQAEAGSARADGRRLRSGT